MKRTITDYLAALKRDGCVYVSKHTAVQILKQQSQGVTELEISSGGVALFTAKGKSKVQGYLEDHLSEVSAEFTKTLKQMNAIHGRAPQ